MKNHKRLLVSQCKYTKTPMSKFECFGHAVKGQCYTKYLKYNMYMFNSIYIRISMDVLLFLLQGTQ